jgi:PAS domain S-box-containing protein
MTLIFLALLVVTCGIIVYVVQRHLTLVRASRHAQTLKDAIVETALDAIVGIDEAGRIFEFNAAAEKLFQYRKQDAVGRLMVDLIIPPALQQRHREAFERHLRTGDSTILGRRIELFAKRADGSEFPIEIAIKRTDVDGRPFFTADIRDIGERRAAQYALEASEARYRAFVRNSTEGIWRVEIEQPISVTLPPEVQISQMFERAYLAECNDSMARMYGFKEAFELHGARLGDLLIRDDPANLAFLRKFIDSGYRLSGHESHERTKDGQERYFLNNLVGEVRDGLMIRGWGTQIDISDRKRGEAERDGLLAREQAAREEAESANRLKDEFLATLSHELRTPLNAIMGFARMLQNDALMTPERHAKALQVIERNSMIQAQLISDLLDLSRIMTGKPVLQPEEVDPVAIMIEAIESVRAGIDAKGLGLTLAFDHRLNLVWADPARLKQVFWNLLSNALKFTSSGGQITVSTTRAGSRLRVTVADTGQGIRPDFVPYIFDRFRQGDSALNRETGGLGLGLSIVKSLVELHGGVVRVASDGPGLGSSFVIELPLLEMNRADGDRRARSASPVAVSPANAIRLDGLSILVVEDDESSAELIQIMLQGRGARVDLARTTAEAWNLLCDDTRYDVIVSDIQMPGEDGHAFMKRLRTSSLSFCDLPAIAVTAHARREDRMRAFESGFQQHVSKPLDDNELAMIIEQLCPKMPN